MNDQPAEPAEIIYAAGVILRAPDNSILLLKRVDTGEWAFPGGRIEGGKTLRKPPGERPLKKQAGASVTLAVFSCAERRICSSMHWFRMRPMVPCCGSQDVRFTPEVLKPLKTSSPR
jgi:ADP-ribose pyrophosphatase YjhB (NUDIX family)